MRSIRRRPLAKVLPFARKPAPSDDPHLDVCLAKGSRRRRYLIAPVSSTTWENRIEDDGRTERRLLSRTQALIRKAELELEIATELGAGWTLERNV